LRAYNNFLGRTVLARLALFSRDIEAKIIGGLDGLALVLFIQRAQKAFDSEKINIGAVKDLAKQSAIFQAAGLNKQLQYITADSFFIDVKRINVLKNEPWLKVKAEAWTAENVALIQSIPDTYFSEVAKAVTRAGAEGKRGREVSVLLRESLGIAERKADLIASDQIAKYQAALNQERQTRLGITQFKWRTSGDERVRDDHKILEGNIYDWDSPPDGLAPGEDYNCRCTAEPVLT
jgi:SPP1 gp7 family putative phage head morphogenesis protein